MRWRTLVSDAKRANSAISSLPPSSAGWALPAMTSWIGRSGSSSSRVRRSESFSSSVRRLYEGTRLAKPMVSTSGDRQAAAHVLHQAPARPPAQLPDLAVGNAPQRCPRPVGGLEVGPEVTLEQLRPVALHPGARVHAVGDVADRRLGGVEAGPQPVEQLARDLPV